MTVPFKYLKYHLVLCGPLLFQPSIIPRTRIFSNESVLRIRWPKYWSFSISPSNEYLGLVSFQIDWFDLLALQGTLKSLLQHHSSKALILCHSAFFMVQIKRLSSSSSFSVIRVVSSTFLRLLIFLPEILIPACASSSSAVCMIYSANKFNKQGDHI